MDNCLLSDNKILPFWYTQILSYFPNKGKSYNNFFNNSEYKLYNLVNPDNGFYSLKHISDIFEYHPELINTQIILIQYDIGKNNYYEFNLKKGMFVLKKSLQINDLLTNTDFNQIIKYTLTNEPKLILTYQQITGIFNSLINKDLTYPNLEKILKKLKPGQVLKYYHNTEYYRYIHAIFQTLIKSLKNNEIEYLKYLEKNINNILGGHTIVSVVNEFKNGKTKSNKQLIIYHTIILCTMIGRYCKKTNIIKYPLSINLIIDIYLKYLNQNLKEDINNMILLLDEDNVIIRKEDDYIIYPDYENSLFIFFFDSNNWWSIKNNPTKIYVSENIEEISNQIYKIFKNSKIKYNDKNYIPILCESGCDNTFAEIAFKYDNSILFLETMASLYSSNNNISITNHCKLQKKFYKDIKFKINDLDIKFGTFEEQPYVDIKNNKQLYLYNILSNQSVVNLYNESNDVINYNYNLQNIIFNFYELMNFDISQFIAFIIEAKNNNYILYTTDCLFYILCQYFGCHVIFERLINGNRYLNVNKNKINSKFFSYLK